MHVAFVIAPTAPQGNLDEPVGKAGFVVDGWTRARYMLFHG
jgi:hypothetical protein